jgi:hypothetical protein
MRNRLVSLYALLFLLVYQYGSFRAWVPIANYYLQKDYIAQNLCANRDRPQLACDGKCHLRTMLRELDKAQDPTPVAPTVTYTEVSPHCAEVVSVQLAYQVEALMLAQRPCRLLHQQFWQQPIVPPPSRVA